MKFEPLDIAEASDPTSNLDIIIMENLSFIWITTACLVWYNAVCS